MQTKILTQRIKKVLLVLYLLKVDSYTNQTLLISKSILIIFYLNKNSGNTKKDSNGLFE